MATNDPQAALESPPPVRADIIAAATRVFSARGYHGASMAEIAHEVGIRKPSLYHHVRKKEDLLFAIHEQLIDELTAETRQAISESDDPSEKLVASMRVALRFVSRHKDVGECALPALCRWLVARRRARGLGRARDRLRPALAAQRAVERDDARVSHGSLPGQRPP